MKPILLWLLVAAPQPQNTARMPPECLLACHGLPSKLAQVTQDIADLHDASTRIAVLEERQGRAEKDVAAIEVRLNILLAVFAASSLSGAVLAVRGQKRSRAVSENVKRLADILQANGYEDSSG